VIGYYSHAHVSYLFMFLKICREQQSIFYNAVIVIAKIRHPFLHFSFAASRSHRALGAE
jgi:hypothetical protein